MTPETVDPAETLAHQARILGDAVTNLRRNMKDKLIILMLNDVTGIGKREIKMILDAIPELPRIYFVDKKAKKP